MHFFDESFWLAICFLIFLILAYRPARRAILNSLDSKISAIKKQLEDSENLRNEAAELLAKTKNHLELLAKSKEEMILNSNENAKKNMLARELEFEIFLKMKKEEALRSMEYEKQLVLNKLQDHFVTIVNNTVTEYIKSENCNISDLEIMKNIKGKR